MNEKRKGEWKVSVSVCRTVEITVIADSWEEANDRAHGLRDDEVIGGERTVSVDVLRETVGPFVRGGWYDLHDIGDVIVFECRHGHRFTSTEIATLQKRLTATGLEVIDSWNGPGCPSVSFRCLGRTDKRRSARLPESVYLDVEER